MILFFDTSALVKLFSNEAGSDTVKKLVSDPNNEVWVLELALVEILCAIYRKARNKEIQQENLSAIHQALEQQFDFFTVIPMASDVVRESDILMRTYGLNFGLRALDALHIAGFNIVADKDWTFISADKNQLSIARKLNYEVIGV